jgi:hypothetical protein
MSSRKYVGPTIICRLETGENMSSQKIFFGGAALEPPRGGPAPLHPPLTPPRARRRCSDTTTRAKNITHTQQNWVRFPSGATRVEGKLQLVHSDVFGPVLVPSLRKFVYYVSFIDEFSRNTWIYFLRKESEVFDRFKEFKALVEIQTKKIMKVLRTNNGREFYRNEFEELCKK